MSSARTASAASDAGYERPGSALSREAGSAGWLRELHIGYYLELRRIIEASEPAERIALVNLQLMRLDEPV